MGAPYREKGIMTESYWDILNRMDPLNLPQGPSSFDMFIYNVLGPAIGSEKGYAQYNLANSIQALAHGGQQDPYAGVGVNLGKGLLNFMMNPGNMFSSGDSVTGERTMAEIPYWYPKKNEQHSAVFGGPEYTWEQQFYPMPLDPGFQEWGINYSFPIGIKNKGD